MDEKRDIIGLRELLDEVQCDLDELRRKHSGDYSIKNIAMWWDLEKDRLLMRHKGGSAVSTRYNARRALRAGAWLTLGWLTMLALQSAWRPWMS